MVAAQQVQLGVLAAAAGGALWLVPSALSLSLPLLLLAFVAILATLRRALGLLGRGAAGRRPVVITGCDSGFGLMAAQQLAQRGHTVLAGCLTADGVARLAAFAAEHAVLEEEEEEEKKKEEEEERRRRKSNRLRSDVTNKSREHN